MEEGDRFCGLCGYALTAAPAAASTDQPTLPIPPAPPAQAAPAAGYAVAAPAGSHGSPGGGPAPGWGSVAAAAPTLVGDPADWSATPAQPDPEPEPELRPSPAGASYPGPTPGHGHGPGPGPGSPYGSGAESAAAQDPAGGPETRHDRPGGDPGAPLGGTPWGPGPENPYENAYDSAPPSGAAPGGKTCVACRAGHVDTDGYCEHCGHAQPRERDHVEEELGSVAAVSDRGLRHHRNEDSFAVSATALPDGSAATVAIVCDGVSSASRPDDASAAAAGAANEALLEALPRGAHPQEAMHEAILAAAAAVNALAPEVPGAQNAPACTLVGAVVSGGLLTIGWVGDSRAYWVPDDRAALPRRLTEDDSWAAQMVAAGLMGEAEAYADVRAHAITGWLGADAYELEPHTAIFKPDHPGVVVVCTDGLWNYAESAREMAQVLPADAAVRPLHGAQVLVGHALDGGGHDNITVAVVPFAAQPGREPEVEARPQV
ncbi:protein phosphatase 2C domain-containing protein [Streptomyces sp. PCS3-D2]|uniref:PP2C family protein-serine/threonine phosphatase n=1 Tax=Streptomyces sp. PCS3-D2 TaxID=1460244 RepID=UPI000AC9933D|nr:PP2C family protein-serine/threonine phosphatase [Streptomyces sp. PCS3-D2]WKV73916.1 protein phosphatase 2C domain-containing protein [Streptomyces sp. PCS3-D2]